MKIKIAEAKPEEKVIYLKTRIAENGDFIISDEQVGWDIAAFRVVDNKISLVRFEGVTDSNYSTNSKGQIEEVEE